MLKNQYTVIGFTNIYIYIYTNKINNGIHLIY